MDFFEDFIKGTTEADIDSADSFRNLLTKHSYYLRYLVNGGPGQKMVQGGASIRGDVMIREVSTFGNYKPGQKHSWVNPQVMENYTCPWRFSLDHMGWTDQEVMLNNTTGIEFTEDVRVMAFIDIYEKIRARCITSLITGMEGQSFTMPIYSEQELSSGNEVQSMALFSNELPTGLYYSYKTAGGGTDTVQGINKLTYPAWDNARVAYDYVGANGTDAPATGAKVFLFDAMDEIILDLQYDKMPSIGASYSDEPSKPKVCVTQKKGVTNFNRTLRINQDWFRHGPDDPAYGAMFDGIHMFRVDVLDDAPIYPTGENVPNGSETGNTYSTWNDTVNQTVGVGEAGNDGPRYHFQDFDTLHKVTHNQRFFTFLKQKDPSNQATDHVLPIDSWHNNLCRDIRRQGLVYPTTPIL